MAQDGVAVAAVAASEPNTVQEIPAYSLVIAPVVPVSEIKRRWQPLADYLTQRTGLQIHLHFYDGADRFEAGLQKSEPDFAIVPPQQVWAFRDRYRPVLRDADPMYGVVVVMKSSPIKRLADLKGLHVAMPEGHDLSACDAIVQALNQKRVHVEPIMMHTHSNGFRALYLGKVDAATGNSVSLKLLEPEIRARFRIVYRTPPLPPTALVVRRDIPDEHTKLVLDALMHMQESDPDIMAGALMTHFTEADLERDYGVLAKMPAAEAAPHAP